METNFSDYSKDVKDYTNEYLDYLENVYLNKDFSLSFIEDRVGDHIEVVSVNNALIENMGISAFSFNIVFLSCEFKRYRYNNENRSIIYTDCKFRECSFKDTTFESCTFYNCEFISCSFEDAFFISNNFTNITFHNDGIKAKNIINSIDSIQRSKKYTLPQKGFFFNVRFSHSSFDAVNFKDITLMSVEFSHVSPTYDFNIEIDNCNTKACIFLSSTLAKFCFNETIITETSFINCNLSNDTFAKTINVLSIQKNFIDLQSILKSDLNSITLELFGIKNEFAKDYIKELVTEIEYQSVFISYSFKDRLLAHSISHTLMTNGIKSFFWERDAPGGRRLKKIMAENIQKHDRLLFIASKNSLRSEACQYELKEAREKQTKEWKEIYYPIHIDNYLFDVRKDEIPPTHRKAFWKNIKEVREFHSKDFTAFKTEEDLRSPEFEAAVKQLIKDLKL